MSELWDVSYFGSTSQGSRQTRIHERNLSVWLAGCGYVGGNMKPLFKTLIAIWSSENPEDRELGTLVREAEQGDSICSNIYYTRVDEPEKDPDFTDATREFFENEEL